MQTKIPPMLSLLILTLAGCGALRVEDQHADPQTRMRAVAARFDQDFRTGGMAQVLSDIQDCYHRTTVPLVQKYALEDCLALDYAGYQTGISVGRRLFKGMRLPFFENGALASRAAHYGQLAGFTWPEPVSSFLPATYMLISMDLVQLNTGPIVIDHPPVAPRPTHMF